MSKSDVFPIQQACNTLSLTINGTTQSYRPNEILRDLVISQVHKDAIGKIGQPVFDFSDHGFGVKRTPDHSNMDVKFQDPGLAYGMAELMQQLCTTAATQATGYPNYQIERASDNDTEVFITFVEPLVIGPLGPWSLLK